MKKWACLKHLIPEEPAPTYKVYGSPPPAKSPCSGKGEWSPDENAWICHTDVMKDSGKSPDQFMFLLLFHLPHHFLPLISLPPQSYFIQMY